MPNEVRDTSVSRTFSASLSESGCNASDHAELASAVVRIGTGRTAIDWVIVAVWAVESTVQSQIRGRAVMEVSQFTVQQRSLGQ
jgi:hypothetical protein